MSTREEWLNSAAEALNGMIAEKTELTPAKKVLVSAGWPRRDRGGKVIGQCYAKSQSDHSTHHIFISPMLGTAHEVLPTLLHELIHAADDCQSKHVKEFRKAWKALGFEGKPTQSEAGPELRKELKSLAGELGKYPHKRLAPLNVKKQSTRMLKVECSGCGCVARMTRKWIEEVGTPTCACGSRMEEA